MRGEEDAWNILCMSKNVSGLAAGNSLSEGSSPEFKGKRGLVFFLPEAAGSVAFVLELWSSLKGSGSVGAGLGGGDCMGGPRS